MWSMICSLPICFRWIMKAEKESNQVLKVHLRVHQFDIENLNMTTFSRTNLLIGWITNFIFGIHLHKAYPSSMDASGKTTLKVFVYSRGNTLRRSQVTRNEKKTNQTYHSLQTFRSPKSSLHPTPRHVLFPSRRVVADLQVLKQVLAPPIH